ncbi:Hua2p SKDI_15G4210 [Saccharomyces kudriavzevii IFO 1802]|uniref:Uncharacterized protein n=2 Tax=Saccharomyces kudriavzevii (strain ATCC MYA-4449 / AS 2.2408 / CBS 8840 / NBRC 1802 / NCYC 2889) TaxID=226230 RepID=A0AA35NMN3_SACK1|nr:uncharacterized protein SKDI_15G4210 [Saccharomyces kudriavzevii IFO 1802]EJT43244.1 HUA2-like protein [Saccharomyces kudriavzevii IFO 1802]CAI4052169.1 hypothetical protein SKDI_15G4210 [Saccharomyces kudriavzevii IFO 1802]
MKKYKLNNKEAMQPSVFDEIRVDYNGVVNSSQDEVLKKDEIILGYKKRLMMMENQMQHLLEDLSFDIQQIEPMLISLQRHYDSFQQLLRKRKNSLRGQNFTYQPGGPSTINQGTAKVSVLNGKFMKPQVSLEQLFDEENILRILQKNIDFNYYFQIEKKKEPKVLLLAMYQCLNGPIRLHKVISIDGIIDNNSIRTILGKQVSSSKWTVFLYDVKLVLLAHRRDVPNMETSKMVVRYGDLFPCALYFKDHSAY